MNNSLVNTALPQTPEGVPPDQYPTFYAIYTAIHNLERLLSLYAGVDPQPSEDWSALFIDQYFFDGNLNRLYVKCNEAISYGQAVSPINVAGELQVRLANATNNSRWCCGFSNTEGTKQIGEYVEVMTRGLIKGVSGMIPGSRYFLNTVNGTITNVAPAAAGTIAQVVGWAYSSNRLICNLDTQWIQN